MKKYNKTTWGRSISTGGFTLLILAIFSLFHLNDFMINPGQDTDANPIDWMIVESLYGEKFESISKLWELDSITRFNQEKHNVEKMLMRDPFILSLSVYDRRLLELTEEPKVNFLTEFTRYGCRSRGRAMNIERLSFCTVSNEESQRIRTLHYRRRSMGEDGDGRYVINAHFDIDKMIDRYSVENEGSRTDAITNQESPDREIPGKWRIDSKSHLTAEERVDLKGTLDISSTGKAGIYSFVADIHATATLREHASTFTINACIGKSEPCSWTSSTTGTLKNVGNRVLIIYDDRFWWSDRLDLTDLIMSGESDWGYPVVYRKVTIQN